MRSPLARAIVFIVVALSFNWKTLGDWAEEARLIGATPGAIRDAFLESRTVYGFRPSRPWKTERRYRDLRRVLDALEARSDGGDVVIVTADGLARFERAFVQYRSQYSLYPRSVRVVSASELPVALDGVKDVAFLEVEPSGEALRRGAARPVPDRSAVIALPGASR